MPRSPSSALLLFLGGVPLLKMDYRTKVGTLILTSLEDLGRERAFLGGGVFYAACFPILHFFLGGARSLEPWEYGALRFCRAPPFFSGGTLRVRVQHGASWNP